MSLRAHYCDELSSSCVKTKNRKYNKRERERDGVLRTLDCDASSFLFLILFFFIVQLFDLVFFAETLQLPFVHTLQRLSLHLHQKSHIPFSCLGRRVLELLCSVLDCGGHSLRNYLRLLVLRVDVRLNQGSKSCLECMCDVAEHVASD